MKSSGGPGLLLKDLSVVHLLEDATEYSNTGNTTWNLKKTYSNEVVVPAGQVWALEAVIVNTQQKSTGTYYGKVKMMLHGRYVSTEISITTGGYTAGESLDYPPVTGVILKAGSFDAKLYMSINNAGGTNHCKDLVVRFIFRRYAIG